MMQAVSSKSLQHAHLFNQKYGGHFQHPLQYTLTSFKKTIYCHVYPGNAIDHIEVAVHGETRPLNTPYSILVMQLVISALQVW
jgi:hypothetical protein